MRKNVFSFSNSDMFHFYFFTFLIFHATYVCMGVCQLNNLKSLCKPYKTYISYEANLKKCVRCDKMVGKVAKDIRIKAVTREL